MSSAKGYQITALLEFMAEHPELTNITSLTVTSSTLRGHEESKRQWKCITVTLNRLGVSHKKTTQWQKVWAAEKYSAKKKAAELHQGAIGLRVAERQAQS